jgi:hypothetical protein
MEDEYINIHYINLIRRQVSFEDGARLASENGLEFMEVSAKSGENVE